MRAGAPADLLPKSTQVGETSMNAKQSQTSAQYDGDLQMFRIAAHEPSLEALRFLRWMAENGRLEHEVSGPSGGEYAGEVVEEAA
jgi:hypothetical protein